MAQQTPQQTAPVTGGGGTEQQLERQMGQQTGQQFGQQQHSQQAGQQMGGQQGGQQLGQAGQQSGQQQVGRQMGGPRANTLDDVLTGEMRLALHDAVEARNACEWCADECIAEGSPEMSECIRLCRDVADLASLYIGFISRGSLFGPDVAEPFAIAAEECARECARHQHSHCQHCASALQRAADSTWELLQTMAGGQQPQTTGV